MTARRWRAQRHGAWAEAAAALWLRLKGYHLLARQRRSRRGAGAGEVDIIARRGDVIAFVEVKLRPTRAEAAGAIGGRQRRRIGQAARTFLAGRPDLAGCTIRFDAVLVTPWRLPCHLCDAWRMEA
jgi:putative endonuclease